MAGTLRTLTRILWLVSGCLALPACNKPPPFTPRIIEHGSLQNVQGAWLLELSGTPSQRGQAQGELFGDQVRWLLPRYLRAVFGSSDLSPQARDRIHKLMLDIPKPHREQLGALAKAAGVDPDLLLAANLSPELFASQMCSSLGVLREKSEDGRVKLARNLDWLGGEVLEDLGLLVIERGPAHSFASLSFPGLVGAVTGMNDAGLAVANLVVLRRHAPVARGVPVMFLVRSALEQAGSLDEGLALLRDEPRTIAQNYALADPTSIAMVETDPHVFNLRPRQGSFSAITNYFGEDQGSSTDGRYQRLLEAVSNQAISTNTLKLVLQRTAIPGMNVQAAILNPAECAVDFAMGGVPAAKGPWLHLDLRIFLEPPGDRP